MSKLIPDDLSGFAETAVRAAAAERFARACMVVYGLPITAVAVDGLQAHPVSSRDGRPEADRTAGS